MSNPNVTFQIVKTVFCKYFIYQSHSFVGLYPAFWTLGITYRNSTAFLSSVLQCK